MAKSQQVEYHDGKTILQGYGAYPKNTEGSLPAVLICHDWTGRSSLTCQRAEQIAELGYVGFAIDMFGNARNGQTTEEKEALIQPFMQDRAALQTRILAALDAVGKLEHVDNKRIAAIGFCFGGLCVLDLARSGADIKGVVSFHGLLQAPPDSLEAKTKTLLLF